MTTQFSPILSAFLLGKVCGSDSHDRIMAAHYEAMKVQDAKEEAERIARAVTTLFRELERLVSEQTGIGVDPEHEKLADVILGGANRVIEMSTFWRKKDPRFDFDPTGVAAIRHSIELARSPSSAWVDHPELQRSMEGCRSEFPTS